MVTGREWKEAEPKAKAGEPKASNSQTIDSITVNTETCLVGDNILVKGYRSKLHWVSTPSYAHRFSSGRRCPKFFSG